LRPKKAKEFIPNVATEMSISEDLVTDVVNYYWREVRKQLSSLSSNRIHVTNLGDFVTKYWKVDEKLEMLEKWEETNRLKGMQELTARFKTAESIYQLKEVKKIIEEETQRKDFIKLHKKKNNGTRS
jgi:hypothetical protein